MTGLSEQIDLAEVLIWIFFAFFAALVFYLRREDKREGYPLEDEVESGRRYAGFPDMPPPKFYTRLDGGIVALPQSYEPAPLDFVRREQHGGAPLYPAGEPMAAGIGPGAYVLRRDTPFLMIDGTPQLMPLRNAPEFAIISPEMDARGAIVHGADNVPVGVVSDLWVDKGVKIIRYIEIALDAGETRLMPVFQAQFHDDARLIRIERMRGAQVEAAPRLADPDVITAREEDRINAYFASAYLYAVPAPAAVP